jgi:hypothetical protein
MNMFDFSGEADEHAQDSVLILNDLTGQPVEGGHGHGHPHGGD